jgi:rhomboid protease GluP
MASRVTDTLSKIPFVTTSLLVLNCGIHAVIFLLSLDIDKFAISADQVLKGEYYRVFSATFVHGGIMHIAMNMSSLLQVGTSLEAQFGSAQFAILTLWSTILIGAVYVLLSW